MTAQDAPGRTNGADGWKPCRSKDRAAGKEQTAGTGVESVNAMADRVESKVQMTHEYLTRHEAADYLRMSVSQLDALARVGNIRRAKLPSGPTAKKGDEGTQARARVLYRRTDLDAFFDAHTNDDTAA